ncbi:MAG: sodium/solute symporter [Sedimentisphaeraceae bacterium JB056]
MKQIRFIVYIFVILFLSTSSFASEAVDNGFLQWDKLSELPASELQEQALGVAGAFAGISNDALIIAGGANFAKPYWQSDKQWHDDIYVLERTDDDYKWYSGFKLPRPVAYGMSVTTADGVVCMGGSDADQCYSDVFILKWDRDNKKIITASLPSLPGKCVSGAAAIIDDTIYIAGGQGDISLDSAMNSFWSLELSQDVSPDLSWDKLASWPGLPRAANSTIAQHNGQNDCIYVIGGRCVADGVTQYLSDVYEYNTATKLWRQRSDLPISLAASAATSVGQSHIFVFGGDDGSLIDRVDELKGSHPGFTKDIFAYHTITDTWTKAGQVSQTQVTSSVVNWDGDYLIVSGEVRPRERTPEISRGKLVAKANSFGVINFSTLGIYLFAMIGVGLYFSFRNKNTDDFFRGGQRIPGWAAGLSMFATLLSSITFVAIPAKVYATDWTYLTLNMAIIVVAPFVIYCIMPFFRKIDATSAYEYFEKRFNVFARMFASISFVLFQIGRMAIVMFLPAIALATITSLSVQQCILIMGVLSIIYCTMGGLEAVIWTDAIQTFILLGGALVSLVVVITNIDGGFADFLSLAQASGKFHSVNIDFSSTSFMTTALWVMIIGGLGQCIVPYVSDQAVVQRYMAVSDIEQARKTVWINAITSIPATLLFFGVGTALFVFYKNSPEKLDPNYQTDAIFPLFIARELPVGISGLVVAGIFAAAQSTVSTSMNSISTVVVTDFVKRFSLLKTEKGYLNLARFCTFFFGVLGTALALLFASADIKSLWESFMSVLGLFGGSMCGLFLLGMFTKRVGSIAAISGAVLGAVVLMMVKTYTHTSVLLYASIGIVSCFIIGYLLSMILREKPNVLTDLTIYTIEK